MKKGYKILALIISVVMLLSISVFALNDSTYVMPRDSGYFTYNGYSASASCYAGSTSSSASTVYANAPESMGVDLDVAYWWSTNYNDKGTTGDSVSNVSHSVYANCSYRSSIRVDAMSTHYVGNSYYWCSDYVN